MDKIDRMALETGEHPFVFQKDGNPVFVRFPEQVQRYLSPQEMISAEKIIMENQFQNQKSDTVKEGQARSLTEKISDARKAAEQVNHGSQRNEHIKNINER